jgi:hypothetical protein
MTIRVSQGGHTHPTCQHQSTSKLLNGVRPSIPQDPSTVGIASVNALLSTTGGGMGTGAHECDASYAGIVVQSISIRCYSDKNHYPNISHCPKNTLKIGDGTIVEGTDAIIPNSGTFPRVHNRDTRQQTKDGRCCHSRLRDIELGSFKHVFMWGDAENTLPVPYRTQPCDCTRSNSGSAEAQTVHPNIGPPNHDTGTHSGISLHTFTKIQEYSH